MKLPPSSVLVRWLLLAAATGLALATAAGYAGAWRYLEVCADYRPYYLFAAIGVLILSLGSARLEPERRAHVWTIALASLAIAVNTFEVAPWLQSGPLRLGHAPVPNAFRMVTFNVRQDNRRTAEVLRFLQSQSADLIILQESVDPWPAALRELDPSFPHRLRIESLTMAVFSRHPVVRTQVHAFGPQRGFATLELQLPRGRVSILAAHASPRHWHGADGFAARTRMLTEGLPDALARLTGPALVVGDLNASMWSPAYKQLIGRTGLRNARHGFGLVNTQHGLSFPGSWLWRPIDHCLYTAQCVAIGLRTGPNLGSDHCPLVVEFDLGRTN